MSVAGDLRSVMSWSFYRFYSLLPNLSVSRLSDHNLLPEDFALHLSIILFSSKLLILSGATTQSKLPLSKTHQCNANVVTFNKSGFL